MKNRQSHQRTQDIMWKPNVGENHLLQYVSIFFQLETSFTMVLYWCSPLPVRRLQPAESHNSLLFFQSLLEGSYNPLPFLSRTTFHKFSNWIHEHHQVYVNHIVNCSNQINSNSKQNPEHLINKEKSPNKCLKTDTQFFLYLVCMAPHMTFGVSAYTRNSPYVFLCIHARTLLLHCILTHLRLLLRCVPLHWVFCCAAYPRTAPSSLLRTHALCLVNRLQTFN